MNGLYLGLDGSNNLCMNIKSREDCLKWRWEGKILKNKTGLVMDIDVNNQNPGNITTQFPLVKHIYTRSQGMWV